MANSFRIFLERHVHGEPRIDVWSENWLVDASSLLIFEGKLTMSKWNDTLFIFVLIDGLTDGLLMSVAKPFQKAAMQSVFVLNTTGVTIAIPII